MAKPLPVGATLLLLAALAFADGARAAAPAKYEYDPAGRRTALKLPNGVTTTYAHDAAGRLTKVESKNAAGNVISAFGYTLDATGNRIAMDVTLNGVQNHIAYEFDHAYRLTRETRKDAAGQTLYDEGLTYDPVGNRLTRNRTQHINGQMVTENTNYAYNAANQLLTETTNGVTTTYGYDKNGNNTTISTPAANGAPAKNIAMAYDWLNRQTKWTDGTRTESTVFAGAGWKRASTTVSGAGVAAQTTKYLYDGDNVLADYDANNALTAFYVTPGLDQNLSITGASGQTAYYTHDGLGSVRLLTSANGAILNRYDYTAFGETFAPNTVTTAPNRYTYTAREQSTLAAHGAPMYYRWRNYAPQIGRFGWRDPVVYKGGVNVYGYVLASPALFCDPLGNLQITANARLMDKDWFSKDDIVVHLQASFDVDCDKNGMPVLKNPETKVVFNSGDSARGGVILPLTSNSNPLTVKWFGAYSSEGDNAINDTMWDAAGVLGIAAGAVAFYGWATTPINPPGPVEGTVSGAGLVIAGGGVAVASIPITILDIFLDDEWDFAVDEWVWEIHCECNNKTRDYSPTVKETSRKILLDDNDWNDLYDGSLWFIYGDK